MGSGKVIRILMLSAGLMSITSSVLWNFTSLYAQYLGFDFYDIGVFNSVGLMVSSAAVLFLSPLIDAYGRKPFAVLAAFFNVCAALLPVISPNFMGFALSFIISNISFLLWQAARGAMVGDVAKHGELGRTFSKISLSFSAASFVTPYIAGMMIRLYGYAFVFSLAALPSLAAAALMTLYLPETGGSKVLLLRSSLKSVLPSRREVPLIILATLDRFGWTLWSPILNPYIKKVYGFTDDIIGALVSLRTAVEILSVYPAGKFVDRVGGAIGFLTSEVVGVLCVAFLAMRLASPLAPVVSMVLFGLTIAFWVPSYNVLVVRTAGNRSSVAQVYGRMNFFRMSSSIPAPWIGGFMASTLFDATPFIVGTVLLILNTVAIYVCRNDLECKEVQVRESA